MDGLPSEAPRSFVRGRTLEDSVLAEIQFEKREEHSGEHQRLAAPAAAKHDDPQQTGIARQPDACCILASVECLLHRPGNQGHDVTVFLREG